MTIGEQIIAAIEPSDLIALKFAQRCSFLVYRDSAADQLEAVVHAHVEAEVQRRMELKVLGTDTAFKALPPIRATD